MQSGKLRHQVNLEEDRGATQTTSGQHVADWQAFATGVYASIEPLTGREYWLSQAVPQAVTTHKIRMRWSPNWTLNPKHRIVWGARIFDVLSVRDVEERRRELEVLATENIT